MKKLHMRLSIELEVTDKQFAEITEISKGYDVEYGMIPRSIQAQIEAGKFTPCDWDNGGYIPGDWIAWDNESQEDEEEGECE